MNHYRIDPYTGQLIEDFTPLSAGITLEQIVDAFTDPTKKFQFPIEGIPVKFTKETQNTILGAAAILAIGGVIVASVLKK